MRIVDAQEKQQKHRHVLLLLLVLVTEATEDMSELETLFLVDGGFGPWSDWGDCSKPCNFDGTANQKRTRQCDSPPPSNNGADCIGEKEELKRCQLPLRKDGTTYYGQSERINNSFVHNTHS